MKTKKGDKAKFKMMVEQAIAKQGMIGKAMDHEGLKMAAEQYKGRVEALKAVWAAMNGDAAELWFFAFD